jgi:hypothetical protein
MDIVWTALVTTLITATTVIAFLYIRVLLPLLLRQGQLIRDLREATIELSEERRLRADLVKWIEIECCKVPMIKQALKQRIDERLEVMRQLREHRRQLPL